MDQSSSTIKATHHKTLMSHSNDVNFCAFSPSMLATASGDKSVRLWSLPELEEVSFSPLLGHSYYVHCCAFSPFGTLLASCSTDGKIILWDMKTGESVATLNHPSKAIVRVCAFSNDSKLLVTGGTDHCVCVFDVKARRLIRSIENAHDNFIPACCFTPDSKFIVSGSGNGDMKLWNAQTGDKKCLFYDPECQDLGISWLAISPTFGSANPYAQTPYDKVYFMLASCGGDSLIKLFDLNISPNINTQLRCTLQGHTANVMMAQFSVDGKLLASGGMDRLIIVWDPLVGHMLYTLEGHSRYVTSLAFSLDNMFLVSGSADRTARVWRLTVQADLDKTDNSQQVSETAADDIRQLMDVELKVGPKPLLVWTVDDVCEWLRGIQLDQYIDIFKENHIDGQELDSITTEVLTNDLGITALGHRRKILRGIQSVKEQGFFSAGTPTEESVPDEYLCPITRTIMTDPVIAADGFSYERSSIQSWLQAGNTSSPMTNAPLPHTNLIPNRSLKNIIQRIYECK